MHVSLRLYARTLEPQGLAFGFCTGIGSCGSRLVKAMMKLKRIAAIYPKNLHSAPASKPNRTIRVMSWRQPKVLIVSFIWLSCYTRSISLWQRGNAQVNFRNIPLVVSLPKYWWLGQKRSLRFADPTSLSPVSLEGREPTLRRKCRLAGPY